MKELGMLRKKTLERIESVRQHSVSALFRHSAHVVWNSCTYSLARRSMENDRADGICHRMDTFPTNNLPNLLVTTFRGRLRPGYLISAMSAALALPTI